MDYFETVARWQQLQTVIPALVAEERVLREQLFAGAFPDPVEGSTNKLVFPDGRILKGTHNISRGFRKDVLDGIKGVIPKGFVNLLGDLASTVVRPKYELKVGDYKKLEPDQRKVVDGILEIKPSLCGLELLPPKEKAE